MDVFEHSIVASNFIKTATIKPRKLHTVYLMLYKQKPYKILKSCRNCKTTKSKMLISDLTPSNVDWF